MHVTRARVSLKTNDVKCGSRSYVVRRAPFWGVLAVSVLL
jgi:hypothetical protein